MRTKENYYDYQKFLFKKPIKRIGYEINQKCNGVCKYCWDRENRYKGKEINKDNLKYILNQILISKEKYWSDIIPTISCFAAEPLLSFDILKEILPYPFYHNILTNGLLLKGEIAKYLQYYDTNVLISLDGIRENHEYYRGKTFDTIINNIINYNNYSKINISMTVNIRSLSTLFESLELMYNLPVSRFECRLNLLDNWTDETFNEYMDILCDFIEKYKDKQALPKYELANRFSPYGNSQKYQKDYGAPLHEINIDCNMLIQKPNHSCLIYPQKGYFFGNVFANSKGFLSVKKYQDYLAFMEKEYGNYNYQSNKCKKCKYINKCAKNRDNIVFLKEKECYPILESFILEEKFWKEKNTTHYPQL